MAKILFKKEEDKSIYVPVSYGPAIKQIPKLKPNEIPFSISNYMDLVSAAFKSKDDDWIRQLTYSCFDSGDGIVFDTKGNIKINLDSQNLRNLKPNSRLGNYDCGTVLNIEREENAQRFDNLPTKGENGTRLLFTLTEIQEYTSSPPKDIENNELLLALARGSRQRLIDFIQNVYPLNDSSNLIRILFPTITPNFEAEKACCIDIWNCSNGVTIRADNQCTLNDKHGYFVYLEKE